jgi:hypothetical protein
MKTMRFYDIPIPGNPSMFSTASVVVMVRNSHDRQGIGSDDTNNIKLFESIMMQPGVCY